MLEDKKIIEVTDENKALFTDRRLLTRSRPFIRVDLIEKMKGVSDPGSVFMYEGLQGGHSNDSQQKRRVEYLSLTKVDKERLFEYSIRKISALCKESSFKLLFKRIGSFVKGGSPRKNVIYIVNPQIYEMIAYIKEYGSEHKGIFRIPGSSSAYHRIVERLKKNKDIEFQRWSIDDLASALKAYIREVLGGIIPDAVCANLLRVYKKGDQDAIDKLRSYFPLVLLESRRELFLKLIDLFYTLDKKAALNFMPISNLVCVMPFVFFPEKLCIDYETAINITRILMDLLKMDYRTLPRSLYIEFQSSGLGF